MNAEGVVVLYAAKDAKTCLAEMRPALGVELAMMTLTTTVPLRLLDFSRLDEAGKALSFFQADFSAEIEKGAFLRQLHTLIAQPVVPGREADYLITQTMAEYLAHVHPGQFNGILFNSAQRAGGTNIVLFANLDFEAGRAAEAFNVAYVDGSIQLFSTESIKYKHHAVEVFFHEGEAEIVNVSDDDFDWDD